MNAPLIYPQIPPALANRLRAAVTLETEAKRREEIDKITDELAIAGIIRDRKDDSRSLEWALAKWGPAWD